MPSIAESLWCTVPHATDGIFSDSLTLHASLAALTASTSSIHCTALLIFRATWVLPVTSLHSTYLSSLSHSLKHPPLAWCILGILLLSTLIHTCILAELKTLPLPCLQEDLHNFWKWLTLWLSSSAVSTLSCTCLIAPVGHSGSLPLSEYSESDPVGRLAS